MPSKKSGSYASDRSDSSSRRSFLRQAGGAFAIVPLAVATQGKGRAETRTTYKIREGTPDETTVYKIGSGEPGPTGVVVGGLHGTEEAGYIAANDVAEWSIDQGNLVVVPEANPVAIKRDTYSNGNGNLNRKFPPGEKPTTPLAREIWDVVVDSNPDIVLSLHSSKGIYQSNVGPNGVGQAIYPTIAHGAKEDAVRTAQYMNRYHLDQSLPDHYRFRRGNVIDADRPLLTHKVAGDLHEVGFIVEVTRYGTSTDLRVRWTLNIVRHLLRRHGINRVYR